MSEIISRNKKTCKYINNSNISPENNFFETIIISYDPNKLTEKAKALKNHLFHFINSFVSHKFDNILYNIICIYPLTSL